MRKPSDLAKFAEGMRQHGSYVIVGHERPDPDALGSMLALGWALREQGKRVTLVSPDPVPANLAFLPGSDEVVEPPAPKAEALVVVDCEPERTGAVADQRGEFRFVYNVDHHVSNLGQGPRVYVDPQAAATAEIILDIVVNHWGLTLHPDAAFNLYAALLADTGGFRFNNTTAKTLRSAARLLDAGVAPARVAGPLFDTMSWPAMELLRRGLAALERSEDGRIAWIVLTKEMLDEVGAGEDDTAGLVQYPRMIEGVDVALLLKPTEDGQTRVSLRAKGAVNVSRIAARFGGGGHPGAAGCTVAGAPQEALASVLAAVKDGLEGMNGSPPDPSTAGNKGSGGG